MGKFVVLLLLTTSLIAGFGIWYTNHSAYWEPMEDVAITAVPLDGSAPEGFGTSDVTAIRSTASPMGFRACFTTTASPALMAETYTPLPDAVPTIPPAWFDCFNPEEIGAALENGTAIAVLGHENIAFGVNRVVAVLPDGRGYAWHVLNNCGKKAYDGSLVGDACPDRTTFVGEF